MTERASFAETLDFCNKVRDAGGANPLDALMPAIPQKQNACLIALNLNFSCSVCPRFGASATKFEQHREYLGYDDGVDKDGYDITNDDPIWTMNVHNEDVAKNIGNVTGLPVYNVARKGKANYLDQAWAIGLPKSIALVAHDFDEWIESPDEYAEFAPYVKDSVKDRMAELIEAGRDYNPEDVE